MTSPLYPQPGWCGECGMVLGEEMLPELSHAFKHYPTMSTTEIHGVFSRNRPGRDIRLALEALVARGSVRRRVDRKTGGRPRILWESNEVKWNLATKAAERGIL